MREIKCRAWDKIEGKMWSPIIRPDGRLMVSNQLGGYITFDDPQDPVMQYTGLKDKNGVEIYEGDLVRQRYLVYEDEREETGEVIRHGVIWTWGQFGNIDEAIGFAGRKPEVVGNIYENPTLVEA